MEDTRNKCRKSVNLRPTQVGESHETGYFHVSTHLILESRLKYEWRYTSAPLTPFIMKTGTILLLLLLKK